MRERGSKGWKERDTTEAAGKCYGIEVIVRMSESVIVSDSASVRVSVP